MSDSPDAHHEDAVPAVTASAYRRAVFEQVGTLEERFGYGFEDIDFGIRARRQGWTVIGLKSVCRVCPPARNSWELEKSCSLVREMIVEPETVT